MLWTAKSREKRQEKTGADRTCLCAPPAPASHKCSCKRSCRTYRCFLVCLSIWIRPVPIESSKLSRGNFSVICLSRACLGKTIVFKFNDIMKIWHENDFDRALKSRFSHRLWDLAFHSRARPEPVLVKSVSSFCFKKAQKGVFPPVPSLGHPRPFFRCKKRHFWFSFYLWKLPWCLCPEPALAKSSSWRVPSLSWKGKRFPLQNTMNVLYICYRNALLWWKMKVLTGCVFSFLSTAQDAAVARHGGHITVRTCP